MRIFLVHSPERPEEVPQPRPQPLQSIVVDLGDPVTIVVLRPLAGHVADRRVLPPPPGRSQPSSRASCAVGTPWAKPRRIRTSSRGRRLAPCRAVPVKA